ncbi:MAG: D-amino-acid transaminase [Alphaproteobacteria bacterium]|nr:D-amino-acid transaminase [Alphaproteobacteria bacterium]
MPGRRPSGRVAYVDGRYLRHGEAAVHVEDRGLQLGDSIYEVMRIAHGRLEDEELHFDRLGRSLAAIEMAPPMSRPSLKWVCREVVRRNGLAEGLLYMQVTRGAFRRDHPIPPHRPRPTLIVTAHGFDVAALERRRMEGVAVVTCPDERWGRCDIKTTQLLANVLAKTAARRAGATEAWLIDAQGFVTEGASTTAWIVDRQGRLVTRPLSHAVLPGVTRQALLDIAAQAQIPVVERAFTTAEAQASPEAFLTSASGTAVPIVAIDGRPLGDGKPGPLTRRVMDLFAARWL